MNLVRSTNIYLIILFFFSFFSNSNAQNVTDSFADLVLNMEIGPTLGDTVGVN